MRDIQLTTINWGKLRKLKKKRLRKYKHTIVNRRWKVDVRIYLSTFLSDTVKQRDDAGLHVSSLALSEIRLHVSPGQLLEIKASLERKWKWHDVIARQGPHALICHPLIQHHCATLTLARRVNLSISCSKCGSLWKATVERCDRVPLLR